MDGGIVLDLKNLTTFVTIIHTGSFTAAAQHLGYAQSTITGQIKVLEESLQTCLFERIGRQAKLTTSGKILYRHALALLNIAKQAETEVKNPDTPNGQLLIGAPESLCAEILPALVKEYCQTYPQVDLQLRFDTCQNFRNALRKGTLDIALFLDEPLQDRDLIVYQLFPEPMSLLASPEHPLSHVDTVLPKDLSGQALLLTEPGCSYRLLFEGMLRQYQITPHSILEISSIEVIRQFAVHGLGITFLSQRAVARELLVGSLIALSWQGPIFNIQAQLAYHRDKWLSPALQAFVDLCHKRLYKM